MTAELQPIDWSGGTYEIAGGDVMDITPMSGADRGQLIQRVAERFESNTPFDHYVYCLQFSEGGETYWYVGETSNLAQRIYTHALDKDLTNIETVEGAESRDAARTRENTLSYEIAIAKNSTNIEGGQ